MDTSFEVDKVFYEFNSVDDLKDFWDSDLETRMTEDDMLTKFNSNNETSWTCIGSNEYPGVILQDKLMTDAALLGNRPIKTEHSYSLTSDGNSLPPESPISYDKLDDMEDDYYPTVHMENSCEENTFEIKKETTEIKHETYSENDDSINSSAPSSPKSDFNSFQMNVDMSQLAQAFLKQNGQKVILATPRTTVIPQNKVPIPKIKVKIGNGTFSFPPTPPSCTSSDDSEDNAINSQPSSPAARKTSRPVLPPVYHSSATRHPIHTPLISSQPKGSTGILILTEEEKKTLHAEGYPVPTRLPLTKAEEKSLKKIRRKIKNKISAQESRRKKKEYMDQLEKKVEILVNENNTYKNKIENLEEINSGLMNKLEKLRAVLERSHPDIYNLVIKQINK